MKTHFKDIVDVKFTALMEEKLDSVEENKKTGLRLSVISIRILNTH